MENIAVPAILSTAEAVFAMALIFFPGVPDSSIHVWNDSASPISSVIYLRLVSLVSVILFWLSFGRSGVYAVSLAFWHDFRPLGQNSLIAVAAAVTAEASPTTSMAIAIGLAVPYI